MRQNMELRIQIIDSNELLHVKVATLAILKCISLGENTVKNLKLNPFQDGHFRDCSRMSVGGGSKRSPLPKICHTYTTIMKLGAIMCYLKNIRKTYESRDRTPEVC